MEWEKKQACVLKTRHGNAMFIAYISHKLIHSAWTSWTAVSIWKGLQQQLKW